MKNQKRMNKEFTVEWFEGYPDDTEPMHKVTIEALRDETWNMAAYLGEDWEDDFNGLEVNEKLSVSAMGERVVYTRTR